MAFWDKWVKPSEEEKKLDEIKELLHVEIERLKNVADQLISKIKSKMAATTNDSTKNKFQIALKKFDDIKTHLDEAHRYIMEMNPGNIIEIKKELTQIGECINSQEMKFLKDDYELIEDLKFLNETPKRLMLNMPK